MNVYDNLLIAGVTVQTLVLAYVYPPRWKALIWNLPLPFTLATLAVGKPVDVTNVAGFILMFFFLHGVRVLHRSLHVPILLAIAGCAIGYCVGGWALAPLLPRTPAAFWVATALAVAFGLALYHLMPHREEPGHRSPMPIWAKLPIIVVVIFALVQMKGRLQGFMTMFPMVGVVEGFRWALLGTGEPPIEALVYSLGVSLLMLVSGLFYFRRMERTFADMV